MADKLAARSVWMRAGVAAAAFSAIVAAAPAAHCFPWSIDMFRGPAIQPFAEAPRVVAPAAMPVTGGEPPMTLEKMTMGLKNPLKPTPENLAKGKELFNTDCAVCHGEGGTGNGSVVHLLRYPPANLVRPAAKGLPDGYLYGYIRNGGLIAMPAYGDSLSVDERWQVVLYVRELQEKAAASQASK